MKRPAIFFDRDNTLIIGTEYLGDPAQVELMPGAATAAARARKLGYATVVVSNQSGVARGYFDEATVQAVNQRMEDLLLAENADAIIDREEYCPFHPQGSIERYAIESDLRKPKPGMIFKAAHALALDLRNSWMIGDAPRDIEAGAAAGCRTILFVPPNLPASPATLDQSAIKPTFVVTSLEEAINYIETHRDPDETGNPSAPPRELPRKIVPPTANAGGAAAATPVSAPAPSPSAKTRTDVLLEQILEHLKSKDARHVMDFSLTKLLAGIVQIIAIAVAFLAYLYRDRDVTCLTILFAAQFLQMLTVALLIMGRQR